MTKTLTRSILFATLLVNTYAFTEERFIIIASTTSTDNSGLFDVLLPKFTEKSGIEARVIAVGTGQAIKLARNGDADILFVHHKPSEEQFVADGFGKQRFDVMYNDFVIVGPSNDPVNIRGLEDAAAALHAIARSEQPFISRGDDSGTHKKELSLWETAGIDVNSANVDWYRETGSGMGATLNVASSINAYALTDRATWLKFKNKGSLEILTEGDERLFNQYGIILASKDKHPHIKSADGQQFVDWLLSDEGQATINAYTIENQQAFFANAGN